MAKEGRPVIGITTDKKGVYLTIKHHYSRAIVKAGGIPLLIPSSGNTAGYAELIDGLLIPGGNDLAPRYYHEPALLRIKAVPEERSDFELSLFRDMTGIGKPVLGICYGMQLVNVACGGTLYQDIDTQIPVEINHKKGYHKIVITENRVLRKGTFSVNSTHHQAVKGLGIGLKAIAFSMDKLVEAFYREDYPFLVGVQWHPERLSGSVVSSALFESFVEASADSK